MSDVLPIESLRVVADPNERLIEWLETTLARARSGEVIGLTAVIRSRGGETETEHVGQLDDRDLALALFDMHVLLERARFP